VWWGEGADVGPDLLDHAVELGELVLGERLGREQVESARVGVLQDPVENRQVVAERLARRRGRHDDHVLATRHAGEGFGLVAVEPFVASPGQGVAQLRMQLVGKLHDARRLRRKMPQRGQHGLAAQRLLDLQALQDREQGRLAVGARRDGPRAGRDQLLAHADA
jgi:hypothetical protein